MPSTRARRARRFHPFLIWAFSLTALFYLEMSALASSTASKPNILIIYASDTALPATDEVRRGIRSVLRTIESGAPEVYEEYLDVTRFTGPDHLENMASFVEAKYSGRTVDVVVAVGHTALDFAVQRRAKLFPTATVVFSVVRAERIREASIPPHTFGIVSELDPVKTLELALRLQPEARNLVVITDASTLGKSWEAITRRKFAPFESRLELTFLAGLPLETVLERVSRIPRNSIILFLSMFEDGTGRKFVPRDVAGQIASAANAPTYSVYDTFLGQGVVGGYMDTFEAVGRAAGTLVRQALSAEPLESPLVREAETHKYVVDGRQMERWELDAADLPPRAEVRFREPSVWDQHRGQVLTGLAVVAFQFIFITALLIERRHRHSIERRLRESEEQYRNVVETQSELICRYLPDTTLTFVNDAYCRYFNRSRTELVGAKWLDLIPEAARAAALHQVKSLIVRPRAESYEHEVLRADGTVGWQHWTDRVILDANGGIVEIQAVGRDLTDLKHAEAEALRHRQELAHLTRVSVVGALSGALAHELNQPLTAILSNAQAAGRLISRVPVDVAEIELILKDIVEDDKRAGRVIQHLRSLLKKDTPDRSTVQVDDLIDVALGICRSDLILRSVPVSKRLAADLPEIEADPVQLQQVLLNLIKNACEAMNGKPAKDRLLLVQSERTGGFVRISVIDSGEGFPVDAMNELYKPFFTTKSLGLGFGLAICKWIMEAHGGRMAASNNPGGGATFSIELPIREEARHERSVADSVSG
ncbi:MAG: PAS domain S-box protein [Mesorhizobium sp.]|nr:MAG: PAS domain S-box protein [Mesorhizobium sp.]